jgi:UDP-N-acetylmuramoyl-tripeptide--D-alanyl-D-alanine ligase
VIPLRLDEVRELAPGRLDAVGEGGTAETITGVKVDSRRVEPGDLFVVVSRGEAFLDDARARGAAATLVPDDAHAALAALAGAVRARSDAQVVGITGSVGKTSTKDILAALVRPHRRTVAAEDGFNNEIGLPLTLCRIEPDTEVVVAELSMRARGQIRDLARVARPHIGVITAIAPVHLELLGSLENIARAKAELLEELEAGSVAVLPEHAPELEPLVPAGLDVRRFGEPASTVEHGRTKLRWHGRDVVFGFTARHQVANAAAALTTAEALGLEPPREPVDVEFSRWRSQETALPGGGLLINDAWNANPVAMRAALAHLLERAEGRRTVAVLGEMGELGTEAPRFHAEIGEQATPVDLVVGVGELARGYQPDEWVATAAEAVQLVNRLVRPGDAILVKGSRAVGLEVVADALVEQAA